MRQFSISILKEEWKKYRGLTLERLKEKQIIPSVDIYSIQVVEQIPDDIKNPPELIERIVRPWAEQRAFWTINGIVLEMNENGISTAFYLEETAPVVLSDYYMASTDLIGMASSGIHIEGFPKESWCPIECINLDGRQVFLLDSERFPGLREYLVVDGKAQILVKTLFPSFNNTLISQIREKIIVSDERASKTAAMARRYSNIMDNGKNNKEMVQLPQNYETLSLREKMEINKARKSRILGEIN